MERDFTVLFRIRPSFFPHTAPQPPLISTEGEGKVTVNEPRSKSHSVSGALDYITHTFASDGCFLPPTPTSTLFEDHVKPLIPFVLRGGYATVLAYGQTGSGKTYTLSEISRLSITALYTANTDCDISITAVEVYGKNKVNDLFDSSNSKVMIAENIAGNSTFAKATIKAVDSAEDMLNEVESAWGQRITRGTEKNPHSSRSHALIRISCQPKGDKNATPGILQLVDLAGSERAADHSPSNQQSQTEENKDERIIRMAETVAINTSLMTLKQCILARTSPSSPTPTPSASKSGIVAAVAGPPHIPFRSSKLTLALKEAFDLYSRQPTHTLFIGTASPEFPDLPVTLNTFRYSSNLLASAGGRVELKPDKEERNVFFWKPNRVAQWLEKYGAELVKGEGRVEQVLGGLDGMGLSKVPEQEFYLRLKGKGGKEWGKKQEAAAKELYLKWWKLVIASRTLSQKALQEEWKLRQAKKVELEERETRQDKEVQRLMKLPGIAAA